MPKRTVITFALIAIFAYVISPGQSFLIFVIAALMLGFSKYFIRNKPDLHKYKPANFLYANLPVLGALSSWQFFGQTDKVALLAAAGLAAIVSDTVSADFGETHTKKAFLITNGRAVKAGTDGAVSMKGTIAGVLAGAIFAGSVTIIGLQDMLGFLIIFLSANIGNLVDSYLGATIQTKGFLNNEQVNFVSSTAAIATALILDTVT